MKIIRLGLIGALAVAGAVYGQQPPDVVTSDAFDNTAMGHGVLFSLAPFSICHGGFCEFAGGYNTGAGYQALYSNTQGSWNTAIGYLALYSDIGNASPTGSFNTASGANTLQYNTTGNENTASGTYALQKNTRGKKNPRLGPAHFF